MQPNCITMRLCRRVFQFVVSETEGGTLSALPCAQFSTLHDAGVSCPLPSQWRPEGFQLLPVENLLACTVYVACMDHLARTKTGFSKPRSSGRSVVWPISTDCSMLVFFFLSGLQRSSSNLHQLKIFSPQSYQYYSYQFCLSQSTLLFHT
jgi:hypothetical protein